MPESVEHEGTHSTEPQCPLMLFFTVEGSRLSTRRCLRPHPALRGHLCRVPAPSDFLRLTRLQLELFYRLHREMVGRVHKGNTWKRKPMPMPTILARKPWRY
jgi:hypothetical protein